MRTTMVAALTGGLLLLAGCAGMGGQPGTPIGQAEVQRELVGKVWKVKLPGGAGSAVEHFDADGTVQITGGLNDSGTWRLWEKGYCTTWRQMRQGAERCFTIDKTPDGQYRIYKPNGEISMTIVGFQ